MKTLLAWKVVPLMLYVSAPVPPDAVTVTVLPLALADTLSVGGAFNEPLTVVTVPAPSLTLIV